MFKATRIYLRLCCAGRCGIRRTTIGAILFGLEFERFNFDLLDTSDAVRLNSKFCKPAADTACRPRYYEMTPVKPYKCALSSSTVSITTFRTNFPDSSFVLPAISKALTADSRPLYLCVTSLEKSG